MQTGSFHHAHFYFPYFHRAIGRGHIAEEMPQLADAKELYLLERIRVG
jgi:hypothetical protein